MSHCGLSVTTKGNVKTCAAAKDGAGEALKMAYKTGEVISLCVQSLGILAVLPGI